MSPSVKAREVVDAINELKRGKMIILNGDDNGYAIISRTDSSDILLRNGIMSMNFTSAKVRDEYTVQLYQRRLMICEIYCKCINGIIVNDNIYEQPR